MNLRTLISGFGLLLFIGCTPEIDAEEQSLGDVDPTIFVAIGTSSTAGYADDALYSDGQENSFAQILATQISLIQEIAFDSPMVGAGSVGTNLNGDSKLELGYKTDCNNETSLSPVRTATSGDASIFATNIYGSNAFENMGVPGLSSLDVNTAGFGNPTMGAGNYSPYYARFASNQNASVLQDAVNQNPTFYTVLLGDEDILAHALSGGTTNPIPPANGAAGTGFDGSLNEVVQSLGANGAKGAIGNIPAILSFPYFTTIPYNGLNLESDNMTSLNNLYDPVGITFELGDNPFIVSDVTMPFGVRMMQEGELLLLSVPLDSVKCFGMGSVVPIPEKYFLSLDEIGIINSAISAYNSVIQTTAQMNNIALVDVNALYASLKTGIVYDGVSMDAEFVTGGFYSLDGRNLNPIGQALLANEFIKAINDKYNAKIPWADVTKFQGVVFP
ncbi:MAG: hypothetical protein QNK23_14475 [Crocinitomicaceae bacterium]|nr:hypothetical protein [Crocinitomicaceae bacterium]